MSRKEQTELAAEEGWYLDVTSIREATARPEWESIMSSITCLMSCVFPLNAGQETKWTVFKVAVRTRVEFPRMGFGVHLPIKQHWKSFSRATCTVQAPRARL